MASPFRFFRKYQYVFLVGFGIVLMFVFVVGDIISDYAQSATMATGGENPVAVTWKSGSLKDQDLAQMRSRHLLTMRFLETIAARRAEAKFEDPVTLRGKTVYLIKGRAYQVLGAGRRAPNGTPESYYIEIDGTPVEVEATAIHVSQSREELISPAAGEQDLFHRLLLSKQAENAGVVISREAILDYFDALYDLRSSERPDYASLLERATNGQLTMGQLMAQMTIELAAQRMLFMAGAGLETPPPQLVYDSFVKLNRRVTAELLPIDVQSFSAQVEEPSEQAVSALYAEGKDRFPFPNSAAPGFKRRSKISFGYFKAAFDAFLAREMERVLPQITDEEIDKYYKDNPSRFLLPAPKEGDDSTTAPGGKPPGESEPAAEKPAADAAQGQGEPTPPADPANARQTDSAGQTDQPGAAKEPPAAEVPPAATPMPAAGDPAAGDPAAGDPAGNPPLPASGAKPDEPVPSPATGDSPPPPAPPSQEKQASGNPAPEVTEPVPPPQPESPVPPETPKETEGASEVPSGGEPSPELQAHSGDRSLSFVSFQDGAGTDEKAAQPEGKPVEPPTQQPGESPTEQPVPPATEAGAAEPVMPNPGSPPTDPAAGPAAESGAAAGESGAAASPAEALPGQPDPGSPPAAAPTIEPPGTAEKVASDAPPKEEPKLRPLDDALRQEIRQTLASSKATPEAREKLEKAITDAQTKVAEYGKRLKRSQTLTNARRPEPLDEAALAAEYGLEYQKTPLLDIVEMNAIQTAEPSTEPGVPDPPYYELARVRDMRIENQGWASYTIIELGYADDAAAGLYSPRRLSQWTPTEATYVFWRIEEVPESVPALDEIRPRVVDAWKMQQAVALAAAKAEEMAEQVRGQSKRIGEVFPGDASRVIRTAEFSWMTSGPQLSRVEGTADSKPVRISGAGDAFMRSVFALAVGEVGTAKNETDTRVFVVRVEGENRPESELRELFLPWGYRWGWPKTGPEGLNPAFMTRDVFALVQAEQMTIARGWFEDLEREHEVSWKRPPQQETGMVP
ncbi:MAG: hypothetical protein FJ276_08325 [Planctomycetes bacterium]|nr:hypothetical protein [Planctomycetota bacterium]